MNRIALFGGAYSNHVALKALIDDAKKRGDEAIFCLGDLGAFGPNPDKVFPLLHDNHIQVVQGNYDNSVGNDRADCQCGYTDPKDNFFAKISYDYTYRNTSQENKRWMRDLPFEIRLRMGKKKVLLCHGSPRKMNEFIWETTSSTAFLERLCDAYDSDLIVTTHTGLHWHRSLSGGRHFLNCGVIGRPANDGRLNVWYALVDIYGEYVSVELVPLNYDWRSLAVEMRAERLPEEFVETIETGYWTTCLEVLPMKERARGVY